MGQIDFTTEETNTDINEGYLNQPKVNVVWDDLRFPATRIRQGATLKPDFDIVDFGLLFPQNDPTEIAYIIGQFPHVRKNGSSIRPHIHFYQDSASQPVFKMDYRWYKNGEAVPGTWTTLTCDSYAFTYPGSGTITQICSFPEIDGTAIDAVSSIIDIRIYRDDNVVVGDVLLKEFDIHYQIDGLGSRQELIK